MQILGGTLKVRTGLQTQQGGCRCSAQQSHDEQCKQGVLQAVALLIRRVSHCVMVLAAVGLTLASPHIGRSLQALVRFGAAAW